MRSVPFLLQTLAAMGLHEPPAAVLDTAVEPPRPKPTETAKRLRLDRLFTLAGHRSHSSHASHGSHASHRSGSTGVPSYTVPAPSPAPAPAPSSRNKNSTPPSSILPSSPETSPKLEQLRGNDARFKLLVMKVQLALYGLGYYSDAIDGIPGPNTSAAIARYERSKGLPVTGKLSDGLLDSLNIQLE